MTQRLKVYYVTYSAPDGLPAVRRVRTDKDRVAVRAALLRAGCEGVRVLKSSEVVDLDPFALAKLTEAEALAAVEDWAPYLREAYMSGVLVQWVRYYAGAGDEAHRDEAHSDWYACAAVYDKARETARAALTGVRAQYLAIRPWNFDPR